MTVINLVFCQPPTKKETNSSVCACVYFLKMTKKNHTTITMPEKDSAQCKVKEKEPRTSAIIGTGKLGMGLVLKNYDPLSTAMILCIRNVAFVGLAIYVLWYRFT